MVWNGYTVIEMDAHIRERADKFFKDYIDPEYRDCAKGSPSKKRKATGTRCSAAVPVIEQVEVGRALGVRDTFGLTARSEVEHARPQGPAAANSPRGQLGRQGTA